MTEGIAMRMSGISKRFSGVLALDDVSFELRSGEIHALLGENGAGKSTLMAIASGELESDAGVIHIGDRAYEHHTPSLAKQLGIAIVHQRAALAPDLSVGDNILLAVPDSYLQFAGSREASMQAVLADVGLTVHLRDRVDQLTIAQKQLLEVAKAFAVSPTVLILDEPTAPLGKDSVELLFEHVRAVAARGTAVVYITHRLQEVNLLADRVTVLRDGRVTGTGDVSSVSDDQLLRWIVGRRLDSTFPPKCCADAPSDTCLLVAGVSGDHISDISFEARRGEIVGIAGIAANGQSELLATLAGLAPFEGTIEVNGAAQKSSALRSGSAYIPADRHSEGLMMSLSVRENAAVSALRRFKQRFLVNRSAERGAVGTQLDTLAVKAASMDACVASLSGGNQQKVALARALLSRPLMVVANEPTHGVDVGARAEIYRILREVADDGTPVVVASSDAQELEGLCDRVVVLSRGQVVADLVGADVAEETIIRAAVSATAHKRETQKNLAGARSVFWKRFLLGDYAPVVTLGVVIAALGAYIWGRYDGYLSTFNVSSVLIAVAALGFIATGQTIALMIGGIDLSVGPLSGFLVVVGSFFVNTGSGAGAILLGFVLMAAAALSVGFVNGVMVRVGKFTAVAATLVTYIAIRGFGYILRPVPGGLISRDVTDFITARLGPFPVVFIVLVAATVGLEWGLRSGRWGRELRAVGSDEESARRLGVPTNRVAIGAFVAASLCVFFGAIVLMAQIGIGDPAQGIGYTLSSVTAVVLGGTSLLGGRGTFVGTLLGSVLIVQVLNATVFLGLSQAWQYFFQGALILVAAVVYAQARGGGAGFRSVKGR